MVTFFTPLFAICNGERATGGFVNRTRHELMAATLHKRFAPAGSRWPCNTAGLCPHLALPGCCSDSLVVYNEVE